MIFFVDGKDRATDADVCITLEASDAQEVRRLADERGIIVSGVEPATGPRQGPPDGRLFTDRPVAGEPPAVGEVMPRRPSDSGQGLADAKAVFFAAAPAEIGAVLLAESTLLDSERPAGLRKRLALAAAIGLAASGLLAAGLIGLGVRSAVAYALLIAAAAALVVAALWLMRFERCCAYVGEQGVAHFTTARPPEVRASQVVRFAEAAELRTLLYRHEGYGSCVGTEYDFVFLCPAGRPLLRLSGECLQCDSQPLAKRQRLLRVALEAEAAWTRYQMRRALLRLREVGEVEFRVNRADHIRLAPGKLTFCFGGRQWTWTAGEIGAFVVRGGTVRISHREATALKGHVRFAYARLSNAALFMQLAERLCQLTPRA